MSCPIERGLRSRLAMAQGDLSSVARKMAKNDRMSDAKRAELAADIPVLKGRIAECKQALEAHVCDACQVAVAS